MSLVAGIWHKELLISPRRLPNSLQQSAKTSTIPYFLTKLWPVKCSKITYSKSNPSTEKCCFLRMAFTATRLISSCRYTYFKALLRNVALLVIQINFVTSKSLIVLVNTVWTITFTLSQVDFPNSFPSENLVFCIFGGVYNPAGTSRQYNVDWAGKGILSRCIFWQRQV